MKINAVVEIPKDSKFKYEIKNDMLVLDRLLQTAVPHNYGYVPNTLAEDRDPLDIFIITDGALVPKTLTYVEVVAIFLCDDNGEPDHKLVGFVPGSSVNPDISVDSIAYYLERYKPGFKVLNLAGVKTARETYEACLERFKMKS